MRHFFSIVLLLFFFSIGLKWLAFLPCCSSVLGSVHMPWLSSEPHICRKVPPSSWIDSEADQFRTGISPETLLEFDWKPGAARSDRLRLVVWVCTRVPLPCPYLPPRRGRTNRMYSSKLRRTQVTTQC